VVETDRRKLLLGAAGALTLPPAIARAFSVDADVRTGTIRDVEHVVILMQENRSFDHYFGALNGVRGFADRFPIPLPGGRTVWSQKLDEDRIVTPFPLDTATTFANMRVEGTQHTWPDAQFAWDQGRLEHWPKFKRAHAMAHYDAADLPFQVALANAFTLGEAYHCSIHGGTNSNRLFLWTGTNDGSGRLGGPSISNSHDAMPEPGGSPPPYLWTTYPERLEAAGVSWRVYEDMADNFEDNPLVGFKPFRDSFHGEPGSNPALAAKGLATQHLDALRDDVLAGRLPQVSWVISPAADSEHPGPSSPAQGADYTARVLDCLTANPEVWARTVFLVMYDENDGFFDHAPPPAPPGHAADGEVAGGSTVDLAGEYHRVRNPSEEAADLPELMGRPYGLGPRVPLFVISPWSRGGWVNGEVFDHTSVIRFLEARFGVMEPNISAWRRAVCGDLTSCFDFRTPNATATPLPATAGVARRAAALPGRHEPTVPAPGTPVQASGVRPSRAVAYDLAIGEAPAAGRIALTFANTGGLGAVLHVYDIRHLDLPPRRYTVEAGKRLDGVWQADAYDLRIFGPQGFHRQLAGDSRTDGLTVEAVRAGDALALSLTNRTAAPIRAVIATEVYADIAHAATVDIGPGESRTWRERLVSRGGWYDVAVRIPEAPGFLRRFAGRIETGRPSISDPAMCGPAVMAS
jgi:phospholipase C